MKAVGIDLALTAVGIAEPGGGVRTYKPRRGLAGMERLHAIRTVVLTAATGAEVAVIEGYSYASQHGGHQLGEIGGVVRHALWCSAIPFVDIPPSLLKRYATGKGNATKDEVLVAAVKRFGEAVSSNHESDAYWLREMALDHYGAVTSAVPARHREALAAVTWPELDGAP